MRNLFQVAECQLLLVTSHEVEHREDARSYDSYEGSDPIHEGSTLRRSSDLNVIPKGATS